MSLPFTVFNRPDEIQSLEPWGISIPASNRSQKIISSLKSDPVVGSRSNEWLQESVEYPAISHSDLLQVHDARWVDKIVTNNEDCCFDAVAQTFELFDDQGQPNRFSADKVKEPYSKLCQEKLTAAAGTHAAADYAFKKKQNTFYLSGGMHHAMPYGGRGFCLVNDVMISAKKLLQETEARKIWVIDTDAHKGDGTAVIGKGLAAVKTLSIHMAQGWPLIEPEYDGNGNVYPWFTPSTVDIGVPKDYENQYLNLLKNGLAVLLRKSAGQVPDFCFVVAGADPYELDELPSTQNLSLSKSTLLARDSLVNEFLFELGVPSTWLLSGGYGEHAFEIPTQFLLQQLRSQIDSDNGNHS